VDGEPQWSREWSRKLTDFATNITGRSGGQEAGAGRIRGGRMRGQNPPVRVFMDGTIFSSATGIAGASR
jgi:hypothetical protein